MSRLQDWDIELHRKDLKGRTFILGNKRAFSLSLPAASGPSETFLHPHKWFGAYLYGRKFLEGQAITAITEWRHLLGAHNQTGLRVGLTGARREYLVDERPISEELFVPDGVQGFTCTLTGDVEFAVDPQFDMRFYRALNATTDSYEIEEFGDVILISNLLPSGRYDDATETFLPDEEGDEEVRIYAAVSVVGDT